MAQLPSSMRDKYMNSDFNQDIAAFHARKGRLPTVLEINRDPNLRKWQDELSAEFKGGDPDPVIGYAYAGYPYASAAPAPGCREKCDICKSQWLVGLLMEITGYDISYTDLEARDQLDHARHIAHQDYLHICKHLENYGDVFVKRWQKRNASKRADLLRKALPDMYARRGFPLVEYLNVRPGQTGETLEERQDRLRTAELLPYLNIDALAESPLEVLALLHRRITDTPRQWSAFDYHQHESSFKTGMVRSSYNPHCVAMSTKRFGCLTLFEKRGIHDASLISFPRAKLLFDAQTRLYSFLRALVDLLLGPGISDIEPTGRDELDRLADAQFSDRLGWTADRLTHNSPFSTPPQFDVAAIVEQFKLRLQAAEDELELLQTDPACLREQLARAEGSAALSGTSAVKRLSELAELIVVGLQKHDNWRYLLSETEVAAKSIGNRSETLFDDQCLPKDYDNALGIFEHALSTQFKAQQDHLTTLLVASKGFKKFFTKRDDGKFVVDEQLRKLSKGDPLFYILMELTRYNGIDMGFHASSLFLYLDDILSRATRQDAGRVDRAMYVVISDMAVINKALTAVNFHRPRCSGFAKIMGGISDQESLYQMMFGSPQDPDDSLGAFMYRLTLEGISDCCYTEAYKSGYKELHPSLAAFMKCPVPNERATRANLDALTQSHEALQGFWSEARRWRKNRMVENELREHEADKRVQCLAFSGNATHAKLIASERQSLPAAIEAREKIASARQGQAAKQAKQANDPQTVWGISEPETLPGSELKSKEKTRPTTQADKVNEVGHDDNINALSTAAKILTIAPKVEVSKDSMRLLTRMYASMDDTKANKGSVKWDDLVAALIDSGFQVTPNGGSAVTFKDTGGRGSIVFHRPHPDPPLDPIMLRSIGKRLAKWFGWEKESFVERGKV